MQHGETALLLCCSLNVRSDDGEAASSINLQMDNLTFICGEI